jgi:biotin-dependent carboxylase-like uncharacterized protein
MLGFKVIQAGFQASIQDKGRFGYQAFGLANSGAMDKTSLHWANWLLHNLNHASVIEIPFGQFSLLALSDTWVCTTGANCHFTLNGKKYSRYTIIRIKQGDLLKWHHCTEGTRAYLAVSNGFKEQEYFGSQSVNLREKLGNSLKKEQGLKIDSPSKANFNRTMPRKFITEFSSQQSRVRLNLIEGNQFQQLNQQQKESLYNQSFSVSNQSDRTATQLIAEQPIKLAKNQMISEPMQAGSLQLLPDGNIIIMQADHPTIGGYPKLGSIFSLDLDLLSQVQTRTKIRLQPINLADAQNKLTKFNHFFNP